MNAPTYNTQQKRSDSSSSATSSGSVFNSHPTGLFTSLEKQRSNPTVVARRKSLSNQLPQPGIIGRWWNNYVRGELGPSK